MIISTYCARFITNILLIGGHMELRKLRYFVAVGEELHFGRAARRLNIAEQPLSYQIKRLEEELGYPLFVRTTRSVKLTAAGESLLENARHIIRETEQAEDIASRIASGRAGVIRLGYESLTVLTVFPEFVKMFRTLYPEVDLILIEHTKAGIESVAKGETDACLVTRYEKLPKSFDYLPIKKDAPVVAVPVNHPLAEHETLEITDLAGYPFLGYTGDESGPVNQFLLRLSDAGDEQLRVSQEAESYMALLGLVAAGMGVTIVTQSMSNYFADRVAYLPLVRPVVPVDSGLVVRKDEHSPLLDSLRTVAKMLANIQPKER